MMGANCSEDGQHQIFFRFINNETLEPCLLSIGTMQNRFLNLDTFFICLAYDDLMVGISDGANCF